MLTAVAAAIVTIYHADGKDRNIEMGMYPY